MKAKDFVTIFANDIKRELLRKNSALQSASDNWGIVTTNIVSQYVVEDITTDITLDVSQYGFTNVDDFDVIATVTGIASERGTWGIQNKTTSAVTIGLFCALSTTLYFHYTIIAKGFGGGEGSGVPIGGTTGQALVKKSDTDGDVEWKTIEGSSITVDQTYDPTSENPQSGIAVAEALGGIQIPAGWGIATVAKTSISIPSSLSATQTIDISGFGFESSEDYTVSCNIYNGTGDWAKVMMNVGNKSATSLMLIAKAVESNTTRVDVEYTIFAKGYGNNVSGWGIAKVISDQVSGSSEYVDKPYDISDLGFTNADDYTVSAIVIGGASGYGGSTKFYIKEGTKTATSFGLRVDKAANATVKYQVTIIAKGYAGSGSGSGVPAGGTTGQVLAKKSDADGDVEWKTIEGSGTIPSGWGIAKVDTARLTAAQASGWYEGTISITDLGFASSDDYTVQFSIVGGNNDWGKIGDKHVAAKTPSQFIIKSSYDGTETAPTYVDVVYTIIAKGYGNNVSGWGVAKAGIVQISTPSDSSGSVNVDISDLGLASVDDYYVAIMIVGGTGAWGGASIFGSKTDNTSFRVAAYRNGSDNTRVDVSYIVVAKGYSGGSASGLPGGGTTGQALVKTNNDDGAVKWESFKTINGESIQGTGDISVQATTPTLADVVAEGDTLGINDIIYNKWSYQGVNFQGSLSSGFASEYDDTRNSTKANMTVAMHPGDIGIGFRWSKYDYSSTPYTDIYRFEMKEDTTDIDKPVVTMSQNVKEAWLTALGIGSGDVNKATNEEVQAIVNKYF